MMNKTVKKVLISLSVFTAAFIAGMYVGAVRETERLFRQEDQTEAGAGTSMLKHFCISPEEDETA